MRATEAVRACFKSYAKFGGRSGRAEYWWFALFAMAGVWLIAGVFAGLSWGGALAAGEAERGVLWALAGWGALVGVPHASVGSRRLRDTGVSGWMMLAHATPSGHWLAVALCCRAGDPGPNRYGEPPEGGGAGVEEERVEPSEGAQRGVDSAG